MASLRQSSDGLVLKIGPRPEGHLARFSAIQTHPSCRFHLSIDFSAYAGTGFRRRSSIRLRIFRNSSLGTATSANWNVTYRPCRTTFAPILISFSRSVVIDQRLASSGVLTSAYGYTRTFQEVGLSVRSYSESRHSSPRCAFGASHLKARRRQATAPLASHRRRRYTRRAPGPAMAGHWFPGAGGVDGAMTDVGGIA